MSLRLASLLLLAGCAAEIGTSPDVVLELEGEGKADLAESVRVISTIEFGGSVTGDIATELELDAYSFAVRPGASISLAVSPATSAGLPSSDLLLFGPRRESGTSGPLVTRANASANAPHGHLDRVPLLAGGEYVVVVASSMLGGYGLSLACTSGECAPDTSRGALAHAEVAPAVSRIFAGEPPQDGQFQRVAAYTYDGTPSADAMLGLVREAEERGRGPFRTFMSEGTASPARVRSALTVFDLSLDGVLRGSDLPRRGFRAIAASYGRDCGVSPCRGNLYVLDFPAAQTIYVVDVGYSDF